MPKEDNPWLIRPEKSQLSFDRLIQSRTDCKPYRPVDLSETINNRENDPGNAYLGLSSEHGPGVNAAFCDGRVTFLSEDIDSTVYARLLTSGGTRYGEVLLSDNSF